MTRFLKLGLIGTAAPATIGVPALVHYIKQPTNFGEKLVWEGRYHLPQGTGDSSQWRAKIIDYSDEVKSIAEIGYSGGDIQDTHVNKLRGWCKGELGKGLNATGYDKYVLLCSTEFRTLRGRLMSERFELASQDDDYKLLFINNKHISAFTDLLSGENGETIGSSMSVETGFPKVKALCERWLLEPFDSRSYEQVRRRCVKSMLDTVGKKLNRQRGFKMITSDGDFDRAVKKWKTQEHYSSTVTGQGNQDDKTRLKNWCHTSLEKQLTSLEKYDEEMQKIRTYCDANSLDSLAGDIQKS